MLRRKVEVFAPTDGILKVMRDTDERSRRGIDYSKPDGLEVAYPLDYRRVRVSSRDVELADAFGTAISAKVECRRAPDLAPDMDVVMDGKVFELTRMEDRGRTCWLWLADIQCDGVVELLQEATTRDSHGIPQEPASATVPVPVYCRTVQASAKRAIAQGIDMQRPALQLRLRTCDYAGERRLKRNGVTYTIDESEGHGRWIDLTCSRKVADR